MKTTGVMMTAKSVLVMGAIVFAALACSPESPKLVEPPVKKVEKVKDDVTIDFTVPVDILFVIDDSGSMDDHQANLASNIDLFTNDIKNSSFLDYHIGVITSTNDIYNRDPANPNHGTNGGLFGTPSFVDRNTPYGDLVLRKNLIVGTNGSAAEEFFAPTMKALSAPLTQGRNKGFQRSNATLVLIFITDTEDQSRPKVSPSDFYKFLVKLKNGEAERVLSYAAFISSAEVAANTCRGEGTKPVRIEEFLKLTNGSSFSLCDPAFGAKLALLGSDIVKKVKKVLYLTRTPAPETIEVRYGTELLPNDTDRGWIYDPERNAIVLGQDIDWTTQPSGTKVEVNFEVGHRYGR